MKHVGGTDRVASIERGETQYVNPRISESSESVFNERFPEYTLLVNSSGPGFRAVVQKNGRHFLRIQPDGEVILLNTSDPEMIHTILGFFDMPSATGGRRRMRLKTIRKSHNKAKKFDAVFEYPDGRTKTVPFGQKGYSDFTKHKDVTRRKRYLDRHSGMGEHWNQPDTPGALAKWVLWNKPTLKASIADFKKKFNL